MFFLFLLIEYYGLNAVRSLIVRNFYFTPIMRLLMMNSCHDENKNEIVWQPTELNYNWFSLSLHFQRNEQSIVQRRHILWKNIERINN